MNYLSFYFWFLFGLTCYGYVGYGLLIGLLNRIYRKKEREYTTQKQPTVSLVIAAYNELPYLKAKVQNCRELDYPYLKIIFVTDGSTDTSADFLRTQTGIIVHHVPERNGKMAAIDRVMPFIDSEITVFTDANTFLNPEAITQLVAPFQRAEVGVVAGEKKIARQMGHTTAAGEGLYWRYESFLKKEDARFHSTIGAAGELYAIRTHLHEPLEPDTLLDDFMLSLRICLKGYVIDYQPNAYAIETASANSKEELKRKIRICAGGFQSISRLPSLLLPWKTGLLSFQYISHRVLRWAVIPFALPFLFFISYVLKQENTYLLLFILQCIFYFFAAIGWLIERLEWKKTLFYIPYYFVLMNYAAWIGLFRFSQNKQGVKWEKSERSNVQILRET